jgi:predicted RNA-binding protein YlxR (DUF448 family)
MRIPERTCIGCMQKKPRNELVRIVRTPGGDVDIDETGCSDGRGAYICKNKKCFETAVKKRKFPRVLRCEVPEEFLDKLSKILE